MRWGGRLREDAGGRSRGFLRYLPSVEIHTQLDVSIDEEAIARDCSLSYGYWILRAFLPAVPTSPAQNCPPPSSEYQSSPGVLSIRFSSPMVYCSSHSA